MSELLSSVEERRLRAGLSQRSVARAIGISQPHYSKVVGGLVRLPKGLEDRLAAWLAAQEHDPVEGRTGVGIEASRIRELAASIEAQLRELNRLLGVSSGARNKRVPSATRRRPDKAIS
ncbi:helix-turn-helix domain-containing protein [Xanthobacter dioxanivorans]|uniref:Helix-turn-helix transcriptional regulator n=2 Tax=Xanthobacter dioxanivorans TaxID=2528964 RepID=A0A974PSE9_9HYPH|nr:helix-turn-helix transcriptional regulator [Xanthobacter dioxanivorans]